MSSNKYHGGGGYPGAGGGPYVTYGYSGSQGDHEGPVIQIHRGHTQPAETHLPGQTQGIEMGRCHCVTVTSILSLIPNYLKIGYSIHYDSQLIHFYFYSQTN